MRTVRLGDLVAVSGGGTPRRSEASYYGGTIPWVTPKDMKSPLISDSSIRLTPAGVRHSPAKLIAPGSVLVVVRSGVLKHTLPVGLTTVPVTVNQDMKALTPDGRVLPQYLARLIKHLEPRALQWVRATTADNFPIQNLLNVPVDLPTLEEQHRIACILDRVESLRAHRKRSLELVDALTASTLSSVLTDNDHDYCTVGDAADVQGGLQVTSARKSLPLEVPYLRVGNVFRNRIELGEVKTLRVTRPELERTTLLPGDVLVVEGHGNVREVGRAAIWRGELRECVHQNHLIRVRFRTTHVLPDFGLACLNSATGRQHLLRAAKTTSGLNTISIKNVKAAPLPRVPLELQAQFVSQTRRHARLSEAFRQSLDALTALFASLQSQAFAGRV